jgi:hypothetical protein
MQPHLEKRFNAEIHTTADVKTNDLFFLCTDGVLESVSDKKLCDIVAKSSDEKQIIDAIHALCNENSRDNFSAYLVSIAEGIANDMPTKFVENVPLILTNDGSCKPADNADFYPARKKRHHKLVYILLIPVVMTLAAFAAYYLMKKDKTPEPVRSEQSDKDTQQNKQQNQGNQNNKSKSHSIHLPPADGGNSSDKISPAEGNDKSKPHSTQLPPAGGGNSSEGIQLPPADGGNSSEVVQSPPAAGGNSSEGIQSPPAGGRNSSEGVQSPPAGGKDSLNKKSPATGSKNDLKTK